MPATAHAPSLDWEIVIISYLGPGPFSWNQLSPLALAVDGRDLQQPLQDGARKASTRTASHSGWSRNECYFHDLWVKWAAGGREAGWKHLNSRWGKYLSHQWCVEKYLKNCAVVFKVPLIVDSWSSVHDSHPCLIANYGHSLCASVQINS